MAANANTQPTKAWTFLTNHFHVLVVLARDPEMRISDIASEVGITYRAVQRILAELVDDGVLTVTKNGRRNCYEIDRSKRLRHPLENKHNIGELLTILAE